MNGPQALDLGQLSANDAQAGAGAAASGARPRQLVLLLDGTNNTLTGRMKDTNVLKLYEYLCKVNDPAPILYYDPGVGSPDSMPGTDTFDRAGRFFQRMYGLAYGRGVYENIRDAYLFLMRNWREGDQIWIFGFSRGAFTARAVSGMVNLLGIIDPQHESMLPTLLRVYFAKDTNGQHDSTQEPREEAPPMLTPQEAEDGRFKRGDVARQIRWAFCNRPRGMAWVHFVGVWDTVESVGMPVFGVQISSNSTIREKRIAHVRHALALDEMRLTFRPRLYNQPNFGTPQDRQSLHQVWFRGVHSDVGGGYAHTEDGLSEHAYEWLVNEAIDCGLQCPRVVARRSPRKLHDTVHSVPWWAMAGLTIRDPQWEAECAEVVEDESVRQDSELTSVWGGNWHKATWIPLVVALVLMVAGWWFQAAALSDWMWFERLDWEAPTWLSWSQLFALYPYDWSNPMSNAIFGYEFKGSFRWSLLADTLIFLPAYAFIVGRVCGWAYRTAAGLRTAERNKKPPPWHRLGLCPLMLVAGDTVENLLTMWVTGWEGTLNWAQVGVQVLIGLPALAKWLGMVGCVVLVVIGVVAALARATPKPKPKLMLWWKPKEGKPATKGSSA